MSVRKGNKIVSGRGKNGTGFALFTPKFFDYILNNPSWLRADTFSWHSGELYKSAYEHLVSDLTKSIKLYAWETSDGDVFYTKTSSPAVDDEFYYSNGGYAKAYITAVDTSSGTLTWENERSRTGTATRKADLDTSYNINISSSTENVGSTEITFYRSADGHKIVLADQESKVSDIYRDTGVAWYYILDTTNKLFKLPRTKYSFTGLRDSVGNFVEAGLPNITGSFQNATLTIGTATTSGALYQLEEAVNYGSHGQEGSNRGIGLDASLSSEVYGKSDTVQPPSTQMYLYFYVGNTVINQTEVDVGAVTEQLNGKQDVLGNNVDYVVESYNDGTNWYRKYKSGWLEQGGRGTLTSGAGFEIITLLKPMLDANYTLLNCNNATGSRGDQRDAYIISETQIGVGYDGTQTGGAIWFVCGKGAQL